MPRKQQRKPKRKKSSFKKKVLKIVNQQAEKKVLDISINNTSLTSGNNTSDQWQYPAQGDTSILRDGNQIRLISLRAKIRLAIVEAATDGALVRIFILQMPDTNVDGVSVTSHFLTTKEDDFYPRELPFKYKILHDKTYLLNPDSIPQRMVNISIPIKNQLIQFDGTGASDAVGPTAYVMFFATSHATASEVTAVGNMRTVYTDS